MAKYDPELSHAEIKAKTLMPDIDIPTNRRAADDSARLQSGPAWRAGLRAWGGPDHHPGKQDTPDIGRKRLPITY